MTISDQHASALQCELTLICEEPVEVQIADQWGNTAWACVRDAAIALASTPGAFILGHTRHLAAVEANRRARALASQTHAQTHRQGAR
jgi:hypothetical protein